MRRSRCVGLVATGLPTADSIGTSAELSENAHDCARSMPSCSAYSRMLLRFLVLGKQRREHTARGDVVLELEPVADDFVESEMQRDGADREVQRSGYQDIAVTEVARAIDQGLGLGKDRRLERDFEQIVGQADESVAVHALVRAERKHVEQRARIEVKAEQQRHAQQNFRQLIDAFHERAVISRVISVHRDEIAGEQRSVKVVESGLIHRAAHYTLPRCR